MRAALVSLAAALALVAALAHAPAGAKKQPALTDRRGRGQLDPQAGGAQVLRLPAEVAARRRLVHLDRAVLPDPQPPAGGGESGRQPWD